MIFYDFESNRAIQVLFPAQQPDSKESGFFRASGQTGSPRTVSVLGGCRGMRALLLAQPVPEGIAVAHEAVGIMHNVNAAVAVAGQVAHNNEKCDDDQRNDCCSLLTHVLIAVLIVRHTLTS